ncbi:MAG: hypothetical protein A2663_04745 [Candidatus Buchananbacteria bacterium RIFCSPHIGHO2_01_FULL_46_12]|uniref:Dihydroorotate dehydrogenase n=1 Tax=Candidatus Buchananbacteria bacterium RIFCSPHIGHO2_01_FULL_46_12 TaxID=1797536 RepID=A0A1G1Y9X5_9BACT|nr:MAG: hypothetical protein A2663_04745 [Candidatus Buchananbacteria bacterium RIFCSPHIGHO2_01_FULL_46_12]
MPDFDDEAATTGLTAIRERPDLTVEFAKQLLTNPVTNASGTISLSSRKAVNLGQFGLLFTKTQGLKARLGNKGQRIWETPSGMLNAIGLPRLSLDDFIALEWPRWLELSQNLNVPVGISFAGESSVQFHDITRKLDRLEGVFALKANFGCPNVKEGLAFGQDPGLTYEAVKAIKEATDKPLVVKLTPNVTNIAEIALAAQEGGADALAAINTILAMDIDIEAGQPVLGNTTGGLSGPAIYPVGLRCVWQITDPKAGFKIPVIGIGGIDCWETAVKYFMAGATLVGIGTANFCDFETAGRVVAGIEDYCAKKGYKSVREIPRAKFPE